MLSFKKQYNFEYDEEADYFLITWEKDNEKWTYKKTTKMEVNIDMDDECGTDYKIQKNNFLWVEDIKKHYNWKRGECIYLNMKQNADYYFIVMRGWGKPYKREEDLITYDIAIDEDGFIIKKYYQNYTRNTTKNISNTFHIRLDCLYNDNWVSEDDE
jgi:hypothetical protein